MKTLGHGNGTKILKQPPLLTQSWRILQHACMKHSCWNQDLVWQLWVMGTVLKSTNHVPVDQKLTYFTAYLHGTLALKSRSSMKTLGHGNGSKIYKPSPLSTQSWRVLQHTCMEHRRWKQNPVWKLWVMGTVLKSSNNRPFWPKVDVFYSMLAWNIVVEIKT